MKTKAEDNIALILCAGEFGIRLTYSDNLGGWSSGTPYSKYDKEWDPRSCSKLAFEIMIERQYLIDMEDIPCESQEARDYIVNSIAGIL